MKKVTLLCGMLLAMSATLASAAPGTNLRWTSCFGDAPGNINKTFACASNTSSPAAVNHHMIGSFEIGADIAQTSGQEVVIDIAASAATLPAWWQFKNVGTCRSTSLSVGFAPPATANLCADWSLGQAAGGLGAYNIGQRGANTARVLMAIAVPPTALADLVAGQEYFSYDLIVNNLKTVGTGSCAGCSTPVCIVFNSVKVTTPIPANDRTISGPTNGTDSNYITWQGGGVPVVGSATGCGNATPTRNATWSSVKSLYR